MLAQTKNFREEVLSICHKHHSKIDREKRHAYAKVICVHGHFAFTVTHSPLSRILIFGRQRISVKLIVECLFSSVYHL